VILKNTEKESVVSQTVAASQFTGVVMQSQSLWTTPAQRTSWTFALRTFVYSYMHCTDMWGRDAGVQSADSR